MRTPKPIIPVTLLLVFVMASACAGWSYPPGTVYDYDWEAAWGGTWEDYFWNRTPFEGYTIVHPPVYVGERWDDLVLRAQAARDAGGRRNFSRGEFRNNHSSSACRATSLRPLPGASTSPRHTKSPTFATCAGSCSSCLR